jgi:hypothetical protein
MGTSDRALDVTCRECGSAIVPEPWADDAVRCASCFEDYLRAIDHDFLSSYLELGVASRRTVAETCLRGLVLESPPARKVLAMAIMEQFLLASGDLIGLHRAIKHRDHEPIVRSFLSFRLDGLMSEAFFDELVTSADKELLTSLGLPMPSMIETRYPGLDVEETLELTRAIVALVRDLRATATRSSSALLLGELTAKSGPALAAQATWLGGTMRPDQVASLVLDERRRQLVVQTVSVDEHRLGEVVDAIDCMTRAASNLIYAYLTVNELSA